MVANFKQRLPYQSGKNQPCPICDRTKDGDCKWSETEALCHTHINNEPIGLNSPADLLLWKYNGTTKDGNWGQYSLNRKQEKTIRPKSEKEYLYNDRNGNRLIKVTRTDDGHGRKKFYQSHWDGQKWVSGLTEEVKKAVPIYRYQEVRDAIANGQPIFMVEGEGVADALWDLGIAATTTLGGSKKYRTYGNYSQDLVGASLVLSPDRDECGLAHMDDIASDFPDAQWCYCFPKSPLWGAIPKNTGVDLADWIITDKATITDIMGAVGAKRELKQWKPNDNSNSNVIEHPTVNREVYTDEEVKEKIEQLIIDGVSGSQLELEIAHLGRYSLYNVPTIKTIYKARLREVEQSEAREDVAVELTSLINANNTRVNIHEILPAQLAQPMNQLAAWLNLKPETYLTTLLTTTSSLFKVGTKILVCPATDWEESPQLYAGIVAPSSQKKSPTLRAIVTKPLQKLQQQEKKAFEKAKADYEKELQEYNEAKKNKRGSDDNQSSDDKPQEPKLRRYSFTQGTTEGLLRQLQNHSDKGILWNCDELAGLFKGANQYKNGKGDDIEAILSMYDGTPIDLLRADESKNISLDGCILSIMGTTQPTVLQSLMKDDTDGNGQWARFCWVQQPLALCTLPESGKIELTPLLADIYQKVDGLRPTVYRLSADGWKLFRDEYNKLEYKRAETANKSSGLSSCYGKSEGRLARLCLNLHVLWELAGDQVPGEEINAEIVKKAIALNRFYLAQVTSLYSEFHQDSLAPHLLKIIQLSERKGWIKAKDVQVTTSAKQRSTPETIRGWFSELVSLGKGTVQGEGRNIQFNCKVDKVDEAVDKLSTNETLDNALSQTKVDKVGKVDNSQFFSNIDSQENQTSTLLAQLDDSEKTSISIELSTLSTLSTFAHNHEPITDVEVDELSTSSPTFENLPTLPTDEIKQLDFINSSEPVQEKTQEKANSNDIPLPQSLEGRRAIVKAGQWHPGGEGFVKVDRRQGTLEVKLDLGRLVVVRPEDYEILAD